MENRSSPRVPSCEVDPLFIDRWSPRSFLLKALTDSQVSALFEAARWSPSCMNEQPWKFFYARSAKMREKFVQPLVERNKQWAQTAPLLIYIAARKAFTRDGAINRHSGFDTGAAWMALALAARKLDLYSHAMAGFNLDRAYSVLGVSPAEYDIYAAIAVGHLGDPQTLPEPLREKESPSSRNAYSKIAVELID